MKFLMNTKSMLVCQVSILALINRRRKIKAFSMPAAFLCARAHITVCKYYPNSRLLFHCRPQFASKYLMNFCALPILENKSGPLNGGTHCCLLLQSIYVAQTIICENLRGNSWFFRFCEALFAKVCPFLLISCLLSSHQK